MGFRPAGANSTLDGDAGLRAHEQHAYGGDWPSRRWQCSSLALHLCDGTSFTSACCPALTCSMRSDYQWADSGKCWLCPEALTSGLADPLVRLALGLFLAPHLTPLARPAPAAAAAGPGSWMWVEGRENEVQRRDGGGCGGCSRLCGDVLMPASAVGERRLAGFALLDVPQVPCAMGHVQMRVMLDLVPGARLPLLMLPLSRSRMRLSTRCGSPGRSSARPSARWVLLARTLLARICLGPACAALGTEKGGGDGGSGKSIVLQPIAKVDSGMPVCPLTLAGPLPVNAAAATAAVPARTEPKSRAQSIAAGGGMPLEALLLMSTHRKNKPGALLCLIQCSIRGTFSPPQIPSSPSNRPLVDRG